MRILIDGDGCMRTDTTISIAKQHNIPVKIFHDTARIIDNEYAEIRVIDKGRDAVDIAIANEILKGDIVITNDVGLATMVLAKGGHAMNSYGLTYTTDNISAFAEARYIKGCIKRKTDRHKTGRILPKQEHFSFYQELSNLIESN